ncbi:MAG: 1-acyl-sn-glycerol-3-phosphate acyltransferase [Clostridia bacterium]|nr:1-acyl-sn-glycerol-3-phosphate acyltransferase [Clostridia bacterium]
MNRQNINKEPALYRFFRPAVSVIFRILFRPRIVGRENIPKDSGAILAGNHTDFFDCFMVISSTKRCVHFLAKNELFKNAFTNRFFTSAGLIRVYRNGKDRDALICAEEYLRNGCIVGIFPEGTTNKKTGTSLPFKIGAVKMAQDTGTPIVPFTINGRYRLFGKGVEIVFQKPYKIESTDLLCANDELKAKVLSKIKNQGDSK